MFGERWGGEVEAWWKCSGPRNLRRVVLAKLQMVRSGGNETARGEKEDKLYIGVEG